MATVNANVAGSLFYCSGWKYLYLSVGLVCWPVNVTEIKWLISLVKHMRVCIFYFSVILLAFLKTCFLRIKSGKTNAESVNVKIQNQGCSKTRFLLFFLRAAPYIFNSYFSPSGSIYHRRESTLTEYSSNFTKGAHVTTWGCCCVCYTVTQC